MSIHDPTSRSTYPIPMLTTGDELPDRSASGLLHRDALSVSTLAQRGSFVVGEPKRHRHT
jgi:hypothetical protein